MHRSAPPASVEKAPSRPNRRPRTTHVAACQNDESCFLLAENGGQNCANLFLNALGETKKILYFERSPPWHYFVIVSDISSGSIYGIYFLTFFSDIFFLAFYLYSILASYLASFLHFFLTFSLAFYVILCGILSDNLSGICPGILSGISCGTLSGILSDIHSFWHMYLAYLLTFFLHSIWYIFGDSLWLRSGRDN